MNCMKEETGPQTIDRILSAYALGRKLRQLRLRKKLGLVELGKHTGLSPSLLSQLEHGRMIPTLPTLARIAMVFDVALDYFFTDRGNKQFSIVRAADRMRFPEAGATDPAYYFECLAYASPDKGMQAYLADFPDPSAQELTEHSHEGHEFLLVLEGSLIIRYQGLEHTLDSGDSLYMDSNEPHGYRAGSGGAKAVVITILPAA